MRSITIVILLAALAWIAPARALEVTVTWSPPRVFSYPPPSDLTYEGSVQATFVGNEPMTALQTPWLQQLGPTTWRGTWLWDDTVPREAIFTPDGGGDPDTVLAVRQPAWPRDPTAHDGLTLDVVTLPEHLWSPEIGIYVWGLYDNCLQRGEDWERPADVTAYDPAGTPLWAEPVGLRINGQSTRLHVRKGLRSYFDDYGTADWLLADVFGDGPGRHGRLVFKSTLLVGHVVSSSLFEPLHQDLGHLGSRHRLAGLYLNDDYWGAYSVRERLDDHFVEVTHQLADNNMYTLIKDDEADEGDVQDWYDFLTAYAVPPQEYGAHDWFTAVESRLDLEAYMDWMFLNILGAAADNGWVNNMALLKVDGGRWQYIMWDEEGLLNAANLTSNHFRFYASADAAEFDQFRPAAWSMGDWWAPHQPWRDLFRGLMQNSEFKARFSRRIDDQVAGELSTAALHARLDSLEALHAQEMSLYEQRWNMAAGSYTNEIARVRQWLADRAPIVAAQKADFLEHFAVPVELSEFAATATPGGAALTWRTERERGNQGFQVWRSLTGPDDLTLLADWRDHSDLAGAPDSDQPRDYAFTDATFPTGQTAWYQLRHEDTGGTVTVHEWVERAGPPPLPGLRLNELMADNDTVIADEAGEFDDWIEIFNPGPDTVSLAGLALADDPADLNPWPLPATDLAPRSFLIVWCDEDAAQGPYHADFKLSAGGESAVLFLVDGGIAYVVDSVTFGPQITDVSLGRLPDGDGAWQILPAPTPGGSNVATGVTPAGRRGLVVRGVRPNPAGERAELRFALGADLAGPARVGVYDLRGRLVREILRGDLDEGEHTIVWDRRDRQGRRAAAGVYLMRVTAGAVSETVKVGLVR